MCKCVLSVCVRVCVRVKLIRVFSECVTEGDCNALVDRVLRIRVAKTHKMPYLYRSISAKQPYN